MDQDPLPKPSAPPGAASKQDRILIWRNEVASASATYTSSTRSAPSLSTTTSSSASISPSELAALSRRSRLWHKIKNTFSGTLRRRSSAASGDYPDFMAAPKWDDPMLQTSMYRSLRVEDSAPTDAIAEEVALGEASSHGRERGGLLETQERLERASRLLNRAP